MKKIHYYSELFTSLLTEVFRVLDIDDSGTIDLEEFVDGIKEHRAALFASGMLSTVPTASQSFPSISQKLGKS